MNISTTVVERVGCIRVREKGFVLLVFVLLTQLISMNLTFHFRRVLKENIFRAQYLNRKKNHSQGEINSSNKQQMSKNLYDSDVTTWSSNGKLYQVEYAGNAVLQGSATAGVCSNTHAVVVALKRSQAATLSSFQEKVFALDKHLGMSVSGLVADARYLARFIRTECMNWRYMYDEVEPLSRVQDSLAHKFHSHTQTGGKRPFGVGLLLVGADDKGPHLLQTHPSGEIWSFRATAIGSRSQSARTYLEKHCDELPNATLEQLVIHALKALANTTNEDTKLTAANTSIGIVGVNQNFEILSEEKAQTFLDRLQIQPGDVVAAGDLGEGNADDIPVDNTM